MLVNHLMLLSLSFVYSSFNINEVDEMNGGIIRKIEDVGKNWAGETFVDE